VLKSLKELRIKMFHTFIIKIVGNLSFNAKFIWNNVAVQLLSFAK